MSPGPAYHMERPEEGGPVTRQRPCLPSVSELRMRRAILCVPQPGTGLTILPFVFQLKHQHSHLWAGRGGAKPVPPPPATQGLRGSSTNQQRSSHSPHPLQSPSLPHPGE